MERWAEVSVILLKASVQVSTQRKQAQREQPKKQPKKERETESYYYNQPEELYTEMED